MFKKVLFFIWNVLKCFLLCVLGVSFFSKGILCLYEHITLPNGSEMESYYCAGIGAVESDFAFLISILFTVIGAWGIHKARYISRHLYINDKTE